MTFDIGENLVHVLLALVQLATLYVTTRNRAEAKEAAADHAAAVAELPELFDRRRPPPGGLTDIRDKPIGG